MPGIFYTSDELIDSIKNKGLIPENQATFEAEDFLRFATEEMMLGIVPSILQLHEDYYLQSEDVPLVANKSNYRIPHRAMGNKLRDMFYRDNNNNLFEMVRVNIEDMADFQETAVINSYRYFYVKNNEVVLVPPVGSSVSGSLVMVFYIRPNKLVPNDEAGIITDINTTTGVITLEEVPSDFSTSRTYDLIMHRSPHKVITLDLTATAVDTITTTISFDPNDLPEELEVGDFVCFSEETIVPQIPSDYHSILSQRVVCRCLDALGDSQGLQNANNKLQELEAKGAIIIDNRVEGSPQKIKNRSGFFRNSYTRRGRMY